ncbi:MAG TPA: tetratricopeptide repeat protein [Thermoanaerobaculia bacterium]|nr:tetratricopeptide repeat protein [Thermoanaerobaculia bacterium]
MTTFHLLSRLVPRRLRSVGEIFARPVHPTRAELEAFLLGELGEEEGLRVILHLVPGCARCRKVTAALWRIGEEAPEGWAEERGRFRYEGVLERVFANAREVHATLTAERAAAGGLLAELAGVSFEQRRSLVRTDPRFRSWGLCDLLLHENGERRPDEPREAAELAELAVTVAEGLAPSALPPAVMEDLRARAWGALADARRCLGDLVGAEQAFASAEEHLLRGTDDLLERARLLEILASLRKAQERFDEAVRLLNRTVAIYRRAGQSHLLGRALLQKGFVRLSAGDPGAALAFLWQGLELAEPERDPRLVLEARVAIVGLLGRVRRRWPATSPQPLS